MKGWTLRTEKTGTLPNDSHPTQVGPGAGCGTPQVSQKSQKTVSDDCEDSSSESEEEQDEEDREVGSLKKEVAETFSFVSPGGVRRFRRDLFPARHDSR